MEVGNIVFSHVVQKGYVKAAGQEVYREDYPALYQFALENALLLSEEDWASDRQGMYSFGDGHMTFRVPDLRGQFLRVLDDGREIDTARVLGSVQGDAITNITGDIGGVRLRGGLVKGALSRHTEIVDEVGGGTRHNGTVYGNINFDASRVVSTAAENRPKNIALIAQIKY